MQLSASYGSTSNLSRSSSTSVVKCLPADLAVSGLILAGPQAEIFSMADVVQLHTAFL